MNFKETKSAMLNNETVAISFRTSDWKAGKFLAQQLSPIKNINCKRSITLCDNEQTEIFCYQFGDASDAEAVKNLITNLDK